MPSSAGWWRRADPWRGWRPSNFQDYASVLEAMILSPFSGLRSAGVDDRIELVFSCATSALALRLFSRLNSSPQVLWLSVMGRMMHRKPWASSRWRSSQQGPFQGGSADLGHRILRSCDGALAMAVGGWRIVRTLGMRIVKLEPVHGFAAKPELRSLLWPRRISDFRSVQPTPLLRR